MNSSYHKITTSFSEAKCFSKKDDAKATVKAINETTISTTAKVCEIRTKGRTYCISVHRDIDGSLVGYIAKNGFGTWTAI